MKHLNSRNEIELPVADTTDINIVSPRHDGRNEVVDGVSGHDHSSAVGASLRAFSLGTPLSQLVPAAKAFGAKFSKNRVDIQELRFDQEGVIYKGRLYRMNQDRRTRLFDKLGAPGKYLKLLPAKLQADALAFHADSGKFRRSPLLITTGDEAVTFRWGNLICLEDFEVLEAVADPLGADADSLLLQKIELTDESLNIQFVTPRKTIEVTPGDIVQSGLSINHHRFGSQATWIEAYNFRLACSNGMTRRECVNGELTHTRRLSADDPENKILQIKQIRQLTKQTWNGLQQQLEAFRATAERPADVVTLLRSWLRKARISEKKMMPKLLAAWAREGSERTEYAAVNALTWVASHDDDAVKQRQRRLLASMAGLIAFKRVHLCKSCLSILTGASDEDLVV
jgi:hypothetical protein